MVEMLTGCETQTLHCGSIAESLGRRRLVVAAPENPNSGAAIADGVARPTTIRGRSIRRRDVVAPRGRALSDGDMAHQVVGRRRASADGRRVCSDVPGGRSRTASPRDWTLLIEQAAESRPLLVNPTATSVMKKRRTDPRNPTTDSGFGSHTTPIQSRDSGKPVLYRRRRNQAAGRIAQWHHRSN